MAASNWKAFSKGIIQENPVFVIVLGLCPTLAVTSQVSSAVGMGVAVIFVLAFSNLFISLLRNFIPKEVRIPAYIMVIAAFNILVQLLLQAFAPDIDRALGIYLPLVVVNCIILGRAEAFASKNPPLPSLLDGLGMGIGFTFALALISVIREALGSGMLSFRVAGAGPVIDLHAFIANPAAVMALPPGGFLVMGLLLALFQYLRNRREDAEKKRRVEAAAAPAKKKG